MMAVCSAWSTFALYDNYTAGKGGDWDDDFEDNSIMKGTIAAHGKDDEPSSIQAWINTVMCGMMLILHVTLHVRHANMAS